MRTIINRKVYDTNTADEIADYSSGYINDFRYYKESLYKTKNGRWFLCGEGGAMSKYSQPEGNGRGYGHATIPLTKDEVIEWLEETEHYDELEEHFANELEEA